MVNQCYFRDLKHHGDHFLGEKNTLWDSTFKYMSKLEAHQEVATVAVGWKSYDCVCGSSKHKYILGGEEVKRLLQIKPT